MEDLSFCQQVDDRFFLRTDDFFAAQSGTALTFDDVTLATRFSEVIPKNANLEVYLAESLQLHLPIISADMDTVTESRMAIGMALNGGMGVIHYNMTEKQQLSEVTRVKFHVHGLIQDPIQVAPDQFIGDVLAFIEEKRFSFSTFPVVTDKGILVGLLPGHAVKPRYASRRVSEAMLPRTEVHTIRQDELGENPISCAERFFDENIGIHKLLVVDGDDHLRGLFTLSDIERITQERGSTRKPARDKQFRLLCAAAVSATRDATGDLNRDRILAHVNALVERGLDAVAVSTAHGHSRGVGDVVRLIREQHPELPIIAGNVTSAEGVGYLANSGANVVKIGQGPGSICTTRLVAGVGIPQLTALYVCSQAAKKCGVKLIADGGITKSGDIVKALTLADATMCGGLLAGCPEAPGQIMEINGKYYKQYRGMGSAAAMAAGSAARYGHSAKDSNRKLAAEGVEALKEVSAPLDTVLTQLAGGIQAGMGYLGAATLPELAQQARFARVTPAGQKESAPHDIVEIKTGA